MSRRPRLLRWIVRSERGSTLPLISLGLVGLFGFSALAVDVGMGYAEARRSQGAADSAALAATIEASLDTRTLQSMVANAVSYASVNLPNSIPIGDWVSDCPDTANPGDQLTHTANELGLTPATDCISFSAGFDMVRVSLPQRDVDPFFASVLGIDTFDVTSFAIAGARFGGVANSPPFVVTAGTQAGDIRCLRGSSINSVIWPPAWQGNGPGNAPTVGSEGDPADADPCDDTVFDTDSEFYGSLKAYAYAGCTQPSRNVAISKVIADGTDHMLGSHGNYSVGDPERIDGDGCADDPPSPPQPLPDTMELQTGYTAQLLMLGMLDSTDTTPRLQRGPFVQSTYLFNGEEFDNTPVWEFLRSDIGSVSAPHECKDVYTYRNDATYDAYDLMDLMTACLKKWHNNPSDDIIFADADDPSSPSIVSSARFAWIPILDETSLSGLSGKLVHFNAFVPVFITTLYQVNKGEGSQGPEAGCSTRPRETPGVWRGTS